MNSMSKSFAIAVVVLSLLALGVSAEAQNGQSFKTSGIKPAANVPTQPQAAQTATGADYVIGAEDVLAINVWKEPDLSRELPVRSDGKITLPLIGDVVASGKTTVQLQAELTKAMQGYVDTPAVTVIVRQIRSQAFNILGQVARPGSYPLTKPTTVLDAIALAGGFREWAKVKSIYVLRRQSDGSSQRIGFNYKNAIKGGRDNDFDLHSRDTIVVP
jgi:polysaccharide biosynthesis/export protein